MDVDIIQRITNADGILPIALQKPVQLDVFASKLKVQSELNHKGSKKSGIVEITKLLYNPNMEIQV